jgi:hypothetical protein
VKDRKTNTHLQGEGDSKIERTEFNGESTAMKLRPSTSKWALMAVILLSDCREQKVANVAGDPDSNTQHYQTSLRRT